MPPSGQNVNFDISNIVQIALKLGKHVHAAQRVFCGKMLSTVAESVT